MRIHMRINSETRYTTKIYGALASWENKEARLTKLTLFGHFPFEGRMADEYTLHLRTDIAFSICKKLEKEGTADLATDYIRGFVLSEEYAGLN